MRKFESGSKFAGMLRAAAVMLCLSGLAVVAAHAQDQAPPAPAAGDQQGPPPGGGPGGRGGRMDPDKMAERLTKALGLSADQEAQIKGIYKAQMSKMEALRSNDSVSREDRRSQMMAMREDTNSKIKAVLTADQKTKFDDLMAKERERMQGRRQGGGGSGDQTPPPPPPPGV